MKLVVALCLLNVGLADDVTATYSTPAVCNGSTVTATPTAAPTVAPKITNTGTYQSAASEKGGLHCSWRGCKWW